MSKNPKIKGIIFQHDDNDYSVWMPDISKKRKRKVSKNTVGGLWG